MLGTDSDASTVRREFGGIGEEIREHLADLVNRGEVTYGAASEKVHDQEDFKRLVHRTGDSDPAAATFAGQL